MKEINCKQEQVLVVGATKLAYSITTCFLQAGYNVTLLSEKTEEAVKAIKVHFSDLTELPSILFNWNDLNVVDKLLLEADFCLAIAITAENLEDKIAVIQKLEKVIKSTKVIAVNTETIDIRELQKNTQNPERILGVNWVEPAHNTQFFEIIKSALNSTVCVQSLNKLAAEHLHKDPYIVTNNSIRAKLMASMVREANYLVDNGYATIEDIDRACRNDAGYYLPFAGNFRYMDLMGTNAYGIVMGDLNSDLSKDQIVPKFFSEVVNCGNLGMSNGKGFYVYDEGEAQTWDEIFRKFSYKIQRIIKKYPFQYKNDEILISK